MPVHEEGLVKGNSWRLFQGDCIEVMKEMIAAGEQFDSVITDPPFHLTSITKRFGAMDSSTKGVVAERTRKRTDGAARLASGFMSAKWDGTTEEGKSIAFEPETWNLVLHLLKPGGRLLAYGGTRTFFRMACAIEDAGFEYEDTIVWAFGQGLVLRRSRLNPGWSPIVMARAPGPSLFLDIDRCRIPYETVAGGSLALNPQLRNSIKGGNGGISITHEEKSRVGGSHPLGRWPKNLCHDGSEDIVSLFPESKGQLAAARKDGSKKKANVYGDMNHVESPSNTPRGDSGSAARFFNTCEWAEEENALRMLYYGKCTAYDRRGSKHPTVKNIAMLRHLVKLVNPIGGRILDPFAGSGTTLEAAIEEGCSPTGIEREEEYCGDIIMRMVSLGLED